MVERREHVEELEAPGQPPRDARRHAGLPPQVPNGWTRPTEPQREEGEHPEADNPSGERDPIGETWPPRSLDSAHRRGEGTDGGEAPGGRSHQDHRVEERESTPFVGARHL